MRITTHQITNPGIYDASDRRKKEMTKYKKAIKRSKFLTKKEKRHWELLGHILTTNQILEAQRIILDEDLKHFKTKQALERAKPKPIKEEEE